MKGYPRVGKVTYVFGKGWCATVELSKTTSVVMTDYRSKKDAMEAAEQEVKSWQHTAELQAMINR